MSAADYARGVNTGTAIGLEHAADDIERLLDSDAPDEVKLAVLADQAASLRRHAARTRQQTAEQDRERERVLEDQHQDVLEDQALDDELSVQEVTTQGYCAHFCVGAVYGDHPRTGTSTLDHGDFCLGSQFGGVGQGPFGERKRLWLHPVAEYFHGIETALERRDRNRRDGAQVGLFVECDENADVVPTLRLTAGEARQLAAELEYIADVVSGLDHPHVSTRK